MSDQAALCREGEEEEEDRKPAGIEPNATLLHNSKERNRAAAWSVYAVYAVYPGQGLSLPKPSWTAQLSPREKNRLPGAELAVPCLVTGCSSCLSSWWMWHAQEAPVPSLRLSGQCSLSLSPEFRKTHRDTAPLKLGFLICLIALKWVGGLRDTEDGADRQAEHVCVSLPSLGKQAKSYTFGFCCCFWCLKGVFSLRSQFWLQQQHWTVKYFHWFYWSESRFSHQ